MLTKILFYILFSVGLVLLTINGYGLTQDIRPSIIKNENLRFPNDQPQRYKEVLSELIKKDEEGDIEYTQRVTKVISQGLAHIHWEQYPPQKFNQIIPIWENYFLYFMGMYSGISEFERYHFADYKRSLRRGIGICGDAAMVLSQILSKNGINNKILTYPGHVIVAANFTPTNSIIFDPDFGVSIPYSKEQAPRHSQEIAEIYTGNGYTRADERFFTRLYKQNYEEWNGVKHFITNKYYFEKIAYALKWPLPLFMIMIAVFGLRAKYKSRSED